MSEMGGVISLFCGPGGLDQGFKEAGFVTRLAYDADQACVNTHRYNHREADAIVADLTQLDGQSIAEEWRRRSERPPVGIIGGPPCQSFSISNVHQSDDDERHGLPEHYARILRGLNDLFGVDFFVFENVPGLRSPRHRSRLLTLKARLNDAGFAVSEARLDAVDFGVPQVRPRVFIVGLNRSRYGGRTFQFPVRDGARKTTVRDALSGLPEPAYFARQLGPADVPMHPNHWCMRPKSHKFTNGTLVPRKDTGRSFRVLAWDLPSYTVAYGHREVHVHPDCQRRLSVFESMRLQGFPDDYVLTGTLSDQFRLVSEAVPPPLARAIAYALTEQTRLATIPSNAQRVRSCER